MKMQAVRKMKPEPGLELVETDVPQIGPEDVLLKVEATAICGSDVHFYKYDDFASTRLAIPVTLGHEFAGEIVEVGKGVSEFKVGDRVAADSHIVCGKCEVCRLGLQHICQNLDIFGNRVNGSFAEYMVVPETSLWKLDQDVSYEIGAIMEPLGGAVQTVLIEPVTAQSVAIFGDGPIALFAAGVARASGARKVYHVGKYPFRLEIAKKMGADVVFNITEDVDVVEAILDDTNGIGVDVSLEMAGSPKSVEQAFATVRKGGRVSVFGLTSQPLPEFDINYAITLRQVKVFGVAGRHMWDTWRQMDGLLQSGQLDPRPVITHELALPEFEKGFEYMMSSHRTAAKVILHPGDGS
jgi:threonine 3-dehydrogenase